MARKFHENDLVTVVQNNVWYTYLDSCRLEKLGKTGRVIKTSELLFTTEDKEWFKQKDTTPEMTYGCMVRFPAEPDSPIFFDEAHLKAFEMPERD